MQLEHGRYYALGIDVPLGGGGGTALCVVAGTNLV